MQGQNPLDQLRPNVLPDPVGFWPPAIGWWLLALLIIVLVASSGYWLISRWRKNRYRTQSRKKVDELLNHYEQHQDSRQFANDCNRLLKQVALHAYPREEIADLHGKNWQQFLADSGKNPKFLQEEGQAFGEGRYTPDWTPDVTALHALTQSWIRKHHA